MQADIIQRFLGFVVDAKLKDLPKEVVDETKHCLLDTLGCVLAGSIWRSSEMLIRFIKDLGYREESTILVDGGRTTVSEAAWANGAMGQTLELDDVGASTHLGVAVVPAALSMAERERISGEELLTSIALGYETAYSLSSTYAGSRKAVVTLPISIASFLGTYAATIAAGKALKLDVEGLWNALGMCSLAPFNPYQTYQSGMIKNSLMGGWPAKVGTTVVQLAEKGLTGTKDLLYGEMGHLRVLSDSFNLERLSEGLGEEWRMLNVTRKAHACCNHEQAPLDELLRLICTMNIRPEDVEIITFWLNEQGYLEVRQQPPLPDDVSSRHCLPYHAAVVLAERRRITPEDSEEEKRTDPKLLELSGKVDVLRMIHAPQKGVMEVALRDGRLYRRVFDLAQRMGNSSYDPMTPDEVRDKFRGLALRVLETEQVEQIIGEIDNLEKSSDVSELISLLLREKETTKLSVREGILNS